MKAGDVVGGYTLLQDFSVVGAGLSEWTFASRDGRDYFLKRFLSPTYPDENAPGSARTKERKRARCAVFESHHRGIKAALAPVTRYGGNLIATLDFFRDGAKYYKVTEKIDVAGLSTANIDALDLPPKLVLLKTAAYSLKILHNLDIVHSDLKPGNLLVKRTDHGYTTKLIDFDSSYIVGSPPPPEEIVGTMNYYSPELVRYIQGDGPTQDLTPASDVFALGLIFCQYLTGSMPTFDPTHHEAAIAVLNGAVLTMPESTLPATLIELTQQMLLADRVSRPTVDQVHASLLELGSGTTVARKPRPPVPPATPSTLRGKGLRLAGSGQVRPPSGPGVAPDGLSTNPTRSGRSAAPTAPTADALKATPTGAAGKLVGKILNRVDRRRR